MGRERCVNRADDAGGRTLLIIADDPATTMIYPDSASLWSELAR